MPDVLAGSQPGLTLSALYQQMADFAGQPPSARFKNRIAGYANTIILDIQANDPRMRRTTVHDAEFSLIAGTAVYDVRDPIDDGGFGWDNCFDILSLSVPGISGGRELEPLELAQYRNRGYETGFLGQPASWVLLDQFRIRISPTPEQAYEGVGDYRQNIPAVSDPEDRVDWPKAWDVALLHGVKYLELQRMHKTNPGAWRPQYDIYLATRDNIIAMDRVTAAPQRAIVTRHLRSRRIPHDNSEDWR